MCTAIEFCNSWGDTFVQFAGPMLVQSSVVMAVLLALNWALERRVRAVVRYTLLMLILVKLVLPPSLALPTGVGYWISLATKPEHAVAPSMHEAATTPPVANMASIEPRAEALATAGPEESQPVGSIHSRVAEAPPKEIAPARILWAGLSWQGMVFLVWLMGVGGLGGYVVRRSRQVAKLVRRAEAAPSDLVELLNSCREQLKIRRHVGLRMTEYPASPALCGFFRPLIFMPKVLVEKLSTAQLKAALLHELGHLRRRDLLVNHVQALLQIFYWYNPLQWMANGVIRRVREQAVDELVMVNMRERPEVYPWTLLEVARLTAFHPKTGIGFVGIMESRRWFKQRLQNLVNNPCPQTCQASALARLSIFSLGLFLLPLSHGAKEKPGEIISQIPEYEVQGFISRIDAEGATNKWCDFSTVVSGKKSLTRIVWFNDGSFVGGTDGTNFYLLNEMRPARAKNPKAHQYGYIYPGPFPAWEALAPMQLVWTAYASSAYLMNGNLNLPMEPFQQMRQYCTNQISLSAGHPILPRKIKWWAPDFRMRGNELVSLAVYPGWYLAAEYQVVGPTTNFSGNLLPFEWDFNTFKSGAYYIPVGREKVFVQTLRTCAKINSEFIAGGACSSTPVERDV